MRGIFDILAIRLETSRLAKESPNFRVETQSRYRLSIQYTMLVSKPDPTVSLFVHENYILIEPKKAPFRSRLGVPCWKMKMGKRWARPGKPGMRGKEREKGWESIWREKRKDEYVSRITLWTRVLFPSCNDVSTGNSMMTLGAVEFVDEKKGSKNGYRIDKGV